MDKSINTITGFSFSEDKIKKSNINKNFFLLKRPSSWGWSTWKSKWLSLKKIKIYNKVKNEMYGNDLKIMNIKQKKGILNSWAYNWTIKHINSKAFCLYPKYSMIKNNGFDNHATNNFFKTRNLFSDIKNFVFKNYSYQQECPTSFPKSTSPPPTAATPIPKLPAPKIFQSVCPHRSSLR